MGNTNFPVCFKLGGLEIGSLLKLLKVCQSDKRAIQASFVCLFALFSAARDDWYILVGQIPREMKMTCRKACIRTKGTITSGYTEHCSRDHEALPRRSHAAHSWMCLVLDTGSTHQIMSRGRMVLEHALTVLCFVVGSVWKGMNYHSPFSIPPSPIHHTINHQASALEKVPFRFCRF